MDGAGDSKTWSIPKLMLFLKSNPTPTGFSKVEEHLKFSEKKNKFEIDTLLGEIVCLKETNAELRRQKIAWENERPKLVDAMRARAREAENRCRKLSEELTKEKEVKKEIEFRCMSLELERERIRAEADMQAMMDKANAKDEAEALRIRCAELEGDVKEMVERNCESGRSKENAEAWRIKFEGLLEKLQEMTERNRQLECTKEKAEAEGQALRIKCEDEGQALRNKCNELQENLKEMSGAKANAEAEAGGWRIKFEDLLEKLQAMTEKNRQLECAKEKAEDEGQALRKKCEDLHENVEEMTGRNSELEDEKEKAMKEFKAWMIKFEDLQEKVQAMTEKNRQLECAKSKAELEDEKEKAEKEVKALRTRCDALHQEVQEMSDISRMNSRLECEKGKVEEEAKALSKECDNLHEKLQEMVDVCRRNCDLECENSRVKEEAKALKIKLDDLQVMIDIMKAKAHDQDNAWRIKCQKLEKRILRLEKVVRELQVFDAEHRVNSLVKVERDVHSRENGIFEDAVDDDDDYCCIILNSTPEVNTSRSSAASIKSSQADVQMRTEVLKRKRSAAFNSGDGRTREMEKLQISNLGFELSSDSCDSSSEDDDKLWAQESDMVAGFKSNIDYCLRAVCALHRMGKPERRLALRSSRSNWGFHRSDVLRGNALAEFLIDGDPEMRLTKTAEDLQGHDPESVDECRRIAIQYSKQLFEIYKRCKDPLFPYY